MESEIFTCKVKFGGGERKKSSSRPKRKKLNPQLQNEIKEFARNKMIEEKIRKMPPVQELYKCPNVKESSEEILRMLFVKSELEKYNCHYLARENMWFIC